MRKMLLAMCGVLLVAQPARAQLSDGEMLDNIQHSAFQFFWNEVNPSNGLIRDRSQPGSPCSIAAVGFGLSSICIGVDHGWVTRDEARARVRTTFNTFYTYPQGTGASGFIGYRGFFYHFLDMTTGLRTWDSELSTIDSALLMAGILDAGEYFNDPSDTTEAAIREIADSLYNRMDWTFFRNGSSRINMGWKPGTGFGGFGQWIGYNEAMILYILALGSSTYVTPTTLWGGWTSGYNYGTQFGQTYVIFPPLFGHQYSHCWVDFRNITDLTMRAKHLTYFENSRRATLAQPAYCIVNPGGWTAYSDSLWGLTACDGPNPPLGVGYNARGAPPAQNDDGVLAPTAVLGSLPFAPEVCMPAIRNMYNNWPLLWGTYGFRDAFKPALNWYDTDFLGIDQGPIVMMIENFTSSSVWSRFMQIPAIQNGLARAGFLPVDTTVVAVTPGTGGSLALYGGEPNPLNGPGTIHFRLPSAGRVKIALYDVRGRRVLVVLDGLRPEGEQAVPFDTNGLAGGVYIARLDSEAGSATRKLVLVER